MKSSSPEYIVDRILDQFPSLKGDTSIPELDDACAIVRELQSDARRAAIEEARAVWEEGYCDAMQHGCDIDKCADAAWEDVDEWLRALAEKDKA